MGKSIGLVLATAILTGACTGIAQEAPGQFQPLGEVAQLVPGPMETGRTPSTAASSPVLFALSPSISSPAAEFSGRNSFAISGAQSRRIGAAYFLLNGLNLGMATLDLTLSQRCIAENHCREANPLMPPTFAGRISVVAAVVSLGAFASRRLKRQGTGSWWVPPTAGIIAHSAGAASGLVHR